MIKQSNMMHDNLKRLAELTQMRRKHSISIHELNPKPLVGTELSPRRRHHSFGSQDELKEHELEQLVGQAVCEAVARRGQEPYKHEDRGDKQYRMKLGESISTIENTTPIKTACQDTYAFPGPQASHDDGAAANGTPADSQIENEANTNTAQRKRQRRRLPAWLMDREFDDSASLTDKIQAETILYAEYTRNVVERMAVPIEAVIANVRHSINVLWPNATVETFGSYATDLWLPSSDIDLVVLGVNKDKSTRAAIPCLQKLAALLEGETWIKSIMLVETAKVPVIKLVCSDTSVPIDITFESDLTHSGLMARDLVKQFMKDMPHLYPLAIVLKQILRERGLNNAYTGGLSSYSTVLLIVHFIQLWSAGKSAFEAAVIYASGDMPPTAPIKKENRRRKSISPTRSTSSTSSSESTKSSPSVGGISYASVAASSKVIPPSTSSSSKGNPASTSSSSKGNPPSTSSSSKVIPPSTSSSSKGNPASTSSSSKGNPPSTCSKGSSSLMKDAQPTVSSMVGKPMSYAAVTLATPKKESVPCPTTEKKKDVKISYAAVAAAKTLMDAKAPSTCVDVVESSLLPPPRLRPLTLTSSTMLTESAPMSTEKDVLDLSIELEEDLEKEHDILNVSTGELLMKLLEFFGILFDFRVSGVSVRNGGFIYRLANECTSSKPVLVIDDPIHPGHNVGSCTFAMDKVIRAFEDTYYALKYFRPTNFNPTPLSCILAQVGHKQPAAIA